MTSYTLNLNRISKFKLSLVGGKAASLGKLLSIDITVPEGFVITSSAFKEAVNSSGKNNIQISAKIADEIQDNLSKIKSNYFAVRSSAVAEDSQNQSWAGQLETFLNVKIEGINEAIVDCWKSLFSPRALSYSKKQGIYPYDNSMAVIVQVMVNSEISGVGFSVNPVTKNYNEIVIEAAYGLGELLVGGKITPNTYFVDKNSLQTVSQNLSLQDKRKIAELSTKQIEELSKIMIQLEKYFKFPVDVEWAYAKDKFYILQSRPITTL